MAEAAVDAGDSVGQWWTFLHIHAQGRGDEAETGGMSATHQWARGGHALIGASSAQRVLGLRVVYEGSHGL